MLALNHFSIQTVLVDQLRVRARLFDAAIAKYDDDVGVGEATLTPSTHSLLGDILPRERIPLAMSVFQLGAVVGSGLAFLIGGMVVEYVRYAPPVTWPIIGELFAWQLTFFYVGAPGLPSRNWSAPSGRSTRPGTWPPAC